MNYSKLKYIQFIKMNNHIDLNFMKPGNFGGSGPGLGYKHIELSLLLRIKRIFAFKVHISKYINLYDKFFISLI